MSLFETAASCAILLIFAYSFSGSLAKRTVFLRQLSERKNAFYEKSFIVESFEKACQGGTEEVDRWQKNMSGFYGSVTVKKEQENDKALLISVSFDDTDFCLKGAIKK